MMWQQLAINGLSISVVGGVVYLALTNKLDDRYLKKPKTEKECYVTVEKLEESKKISDVMLHTITQSIARIDASVTDNFKAIFIKFDNVNEHIIALSKSKK